MELIREIIYEPYYCLKHINSITKSNLPIEQSNKYRYELLNYVDEIKINSETGELYFDNYLQIDDYIIYINRVDIITNQNIITCYILFVRDSDEMDET